MFQRCIQCNTQYPLDRIIYTCPACDALLEIAIDARCAAGATFSGTGVWRYAPLLPADPDRAITLGEGATGLHRCDRLAKMCRVDELYVKNEGENPTGSFKDRGMTIGVTVACTLGARAVACASTGNTSASMAAYAGRAGLAAIVLVPGGKVALGKVAQAIVHGAKIVQVEGNFDDAMRLVRELSCAPGGAYLLNSINPFRLEGQKTLAFEVCEALGGPPDTVVLPMGNAGNISAIWKGFCEFKAAGWIDRLPRMIGIQAAGAAPIVHTLHAGADSCHVADPETVATAIRIGAPVNWRKAVAAIRDSSGTAAVVSDEAILEAQRELARCEGLFVEPASAAPIAYLRGVSGAGLGRVVCVATGHGLKDPDVIIKNTLTILQAKPTLESLRAALGPGQTSRAGALVSGEK